MEKELVELFETAKKSADAAATVDGSADESRCLDALGQLKKFPVTYHLLVSTQVGKRLRPLTKHPRKKIQTSASSLIEMWKDIVIKETSKDAKNGKLDHMSSPRIESPRPEKIQKTSAMKIEKSSSFKAEHNSAEKKVQTLTAARTVKTESVKAERVITKEAKKPTPGSSTAPKLTTMIRSNDAARDKVREMLHEALSKVRAEADPEFADEVRASDPIRVAVTVESVLFENWGGSTGSQKAKYRSLIFNLKDSKNPDFRRKVLLGHFKPEKLVDLSTTEMASDERRQETKKLEEKALFECQRGGQKEATTDQFKCGRCGQRKTTYYQMQTRSADEPMTTYVTCVNCNNRWKFC